MDRIATLKRILHAQLGASYAPTYFQTETPMLGTIPELDSMAVVGILTAIEDEFEVQIQDDAISVDVFRTFGALSDFVVGLQDA